MKGTSLSDLSQLLQKAEDLPPNIKTVLENMVQERKITYSSQFDDSDD